MGWYEFMYKIGAGIAHFLVGLLIQFCCIKYARNPQCDAGTEKQFNVANGFFSPSSTRLNQALETAAHGELALALTISGYDLVHGHLMV